MSYVSYPDHDWVQLATCPRCGCTDEMPFAHWRHDSIAWAECPDCGESFDIELDTEPDVDAFLDYQDARAQADLDHFYPI